MSLYTVSVSVLGFKPKVWVEQGALHARTSLMVQLLTLFSCCRRVTIDRNRRVIEIATRWLWAISARRAIPLERAHFLEYDFRSVGTSWGGMMTGFERTDQVERYRVILVLKDPSERVRLFSFYGEGAVQTGWYGVVFGEDSLIDVSGDQGEASLSFVDLLQHMLEVPLGRPLEYIEERKRTGPVCVKCGRAAPPNKTKCMYCGGALKRRP